MTLQFQCVYDFNNFLAWLNYYHLGDINYLYILSIVVLGVMPLVVFMSGARIGGKILDIGSKVGSIVGGAAGVVAVIQNNGIKGGNSGGGNNGGNNGGGGGSGGNKAGDSGGGKK